MYGNQKGKKIKDSGVVLWKSERSGNVKIDFDLFFYNITKIDFEDPGNNGFELLERHSLVWILSLSVLHHEQFINLGISFENCQTHFFKEKKEGRERNDGF